MARKWFAAKTLYRTTLRGRARPVDLTYVPDNAAVEERVVLLRARSLKDAMRRAEAEARAYARLDMGTNRYGQEIVTRYLEAVNVYEMFDAPGDAVEVFSSIYVIGREVRDRTIVENHFGPRDQPLDARTQFLNGKISLMTDPRRK